MVSCTKCETANSLDSAFCKHCGSPIAAEAVAAGRLSLGKRVADGMTLFDSGHIDEAGDIAVELLAIEPDSPRALTLKALVLDRRGRQADALAIVDQILATEHENPADLARIHQLRARLIDSRSPTPSTRRLAILGAAAACLLVIAVGSLAATLSLGRAPAAVAKTETRPQQIETPFTASDGIEQPAGAEQNPPAAAIEQEPPQQESEPKPEPQLPEATTTLPKPEGNLSGEVQPVAPLPRGIEIRPETTPKGDPDPEPTGSSPQMVAKEPEKRPEPPPIVDIRLSEPIKGSEAPMNANGVEALIRTARGQYQVGNFQAAAGSYERALRAGADPGTTNQRLAQCYEQLGRRSDAIEAYQRSVTSLERSVSAGKGGDRMRAVLDSSKQALKNLQGA